MLVNDKKYFVALMLKLFYNEKCWDIICVDVGK
jgi:hypothetical protein